MFELDESGWQEGLPLFHILVDGDFWVGRYAFMRIWEKPTE